MTDVHTGKTKDEGKDPTDKAEEGEITRACQCCDDACDYNTPAQSVEEKGS
jgi:hypothetical protein